MVLIAVKLTINYSWSLLNKWKFAYRQACRPGSCCLPRQCCSAASTVTSKSYKGWFGPAGSWPCCCGTKVPDRVQLSTSAQMPGLGNSLFCRKLQGLVLQRCHSPSCAHLRTNGSPSLLWCVLRMPEHACEWHGSKLIKGRVVIC